MSKVVIYTDGACLGNPWPALIARSALREDVFLKNAAAH